jgi:hypothetical protein
LLNKHEYNEKRFNWCNCFFNGDFFSCSKTNEDKLSGNDTNIQNCDTTNMSYSNDIVPILSDYCYACHGKNTNDGSDGIILEEYGNISGRAINGTLMGVITHASGFPAMPQDGPKLSDCNINKIRAWINNGAQNN